LNLSLFKKVDPTASIATYQNEIIGFDDLRSPNATNRIAELDGLRGVAILIVLTFHYINNQLENASTKFGKIFHGLTSFGWTGVDLFFVLSGFLIGTILIRNRDSKTFFSTFYIRRIVRIIPNYYLLIALFVVVNAMPYFYPDYFLTGNKVIPVWAYLLMVHNFFISHLENMGNESISITWSIAIEEQFYIIFPFLVYFLRVKWLPWILAVAIITAPLIRMQFGNWLPAYVLLICRMDSIAFGAMIAFINHFYSLSDMVKKRIVPIAIVLILNFLVCAVLFLKYNDLGVLRNTLIDILFSAMLVFALVYKKSFYSKILSNKVLVWVGTISYSLYLFHNIILGILNHIFSGQGLEYPHGIPITILALAVSLFCSWFIYKKLETPFVKIGKKFKY
jgi:peptidoglycan/LPS O-acetylase OafA/YrhL